MVNQPIGNHGWEFSGVVGFDLGHLFQGQTRIAKVKSANKLLIIGPRGLGWQSSLQEIMGWEPFDVVRFDLGPLPSRSYEDSQT